MLPGAAVMRTECTIPTITLNIPAKLNAFTQDLYYLLAQRLREVDKRDDIYITVITGTGRFFSA
jgi:Delta3-Delta2-enoyl-CoA isomerase